MLSWMSSSALKIQTDTTLFWDYTKQLFFMLKYLRSTSKDPLLCYTWHSIIQLWNTCVMYTDLCDDFFCGVRLYSSGYHRLSKRMEKKEKVFWHHRLLPVLLKIVSLVHAEARLHALMWQQWLFSHLIKPKWGKYLDSSLMVLTSMMR